MPPFTVAEGRAAVLMQPNIDTDVVIHIDRLNASRMHPEGRRLLGQWAFETLRFDAAGAERLDCVLNDAVLEEAPILIAGPNFGCGSSREGAVWAIMGLGFRCTIAESFGDIFHANCFQNGFLPVVLPADAVASLAREAAAGAVLRVDLEAEQVTGPGGLAVPFRIDPSRRRALLLGLDEFGQTLQHDAAIAGWQAADELSRPWIWQS